ncbi:MAG: glutamate--tRNA ligase [Firmicutes bacterium]|nr:glutamate--tRNA ligase [Bacillota bacterium]
MAARVRVRFAPSPTGYLHIGGARTALYDWLLAKKEKGLFLLRIEDTDRSRYVPEAMEDIMESLRWLGLHWDEGPDVGGPAGPYQQSERVELYRRHAEDLVARGKAYYCFCPPERLEELRRSGYGYDGHCRELPAEVCREYLEEGKKAVIRFKIPQEGKITVRDYLRGEMVFDLQTLDDFVLLKSDGFPTYHLAVVVDDHLMEISHVMRGDEWLPSVPRHILLYEAFGWEPPVFIHLPVLLAPDGKGKLSKRHGATSLREYREKGYLPEAVNNFLLLLGWHPPDDREVLTMEEAAAVFSPERINTSPVAFSLEKLDWLNGVYIRQLAPEDLAARALPFLQKDGVLPDPCPPERFAYLVRIIPLVQERLKLLSEISQQTAYFFQEEIPVPPPELLVGKKSSAGETRELLAAALKALEGVEDFSAAALEEVLRGLAAELGIKPGPLFMPIRVAITGRTATPGLFETMEAIGKPRVLQRIRAAIEGLA